MSKYYFLFVFFLILALAMRVFLYFHFHKEVKLPKNQPVRFEATITKDARISDGGQVISVADSKIYTDLYPRYTVGDRISVEGKADDKGRMFGAKIQRVGQRRGFFVYLTKLRREISEKFFAMLPQDEATLVVGSVLGVDQINASFRDKLIKTGTIHVVVVSGQNLMILVGVLASLVNYIGRRRTRILTLALVFFYALLTGFEPPVVRATLMVLFTTLALFFGREIRPVWGLFFAAVLIIFIWPAAISEVSFQLTFAATLGIVTLGSWLQKLLGKYGLLGNNAAVATSAYVFTAPIILYYFGQVSAIAPLVNVLVIEAVAPVMALGFLVAIASLVFLPLAQILAYLAFVPALYFVKVVEAFAKLDVGQISIGKENFWLAFGFYAAILAILLIFRNPKKPSRESDALWGQVKAKPWQGKHGI